MNLLLGNLRCRRESNVSIIKRSYIYDESECLLATISVLIILLFSENLLLQQSMMMMMTQ